MIRKCSWPLLLFGDGDRLRNASDFVFAVRSGPGGWVVADLVSEAPMFADVICRPVAPRLPPAFDGLIADHGQALPNSPPTLFRVHGLEYHDPARAVRLQARNCVRDVSFQT